MAQKRTVRTTSLVTLAALLAMIAGSPEKSEAQAITSGRCPPSCEVIVEVPAEVSKRPQVSLDTITTAPGSKIVFRPNGRVSVVFTDQTPFVGPDGVPIYRFDVRSNRSVAMTVRADAADLCAPPGCKYMIIDTRNQNRPPLDPYIIIER